MKTTTVWIRVFLAALLFSACTSPAERALEAAGLGDAPGVLEQLEAVDGELRPEVRAESFILAASRGHVGVISALLDEGVPVDVQLPKRVGGEVEETKDGLLFPVRPEHVGRSALFAAVKSSQVDTVRVLLDQGADPDLPVVDESWLPEIFDVVVGPDTIEDMLASGNGFRWSDEYFVSPRGEFVLSNLPPRKIWTSPRKAAAEKLDDKRGSDGARRVAELLSVPIAD